MTATGRSQSFGQFYCLTRKVRFPAESGVQVD